MMKSLTLLLLVGLMMSACASTQPAFADQPAIGVNVQWPGSGGYYPTNGYPATYPTNNNVYYPVPVYTNGYNGGHPATGYNSGSCNNGYQTYGNNGYWNQRRAWLEHERRERERRERREHERWEHQRWQGRR